MEGVLTAAGVLGGLSRLEALCAGEGGSQLRSGLFLPRLLTGPHSMAVESRLGLRFLESTRVYRLKVAVLYGRVRDPMTERWLINTI